jgi:hypothetical protein
MDNATCMLLRRVHHPRWREVKSLYARLDKSCRLQCRTALGRLVMEFFLE